MKERMQHDFPANVYFISPLMTIWVVISIMTRYRNRKHLVDLLAATEHAAAHLIGSTGKYRGHWDAMPKHLPMRLKIDNPLFLDYISPRMNLQTQSKSSRRRRR